MRRTLNILGAVVLVLLLALRRPFASAIRELSKPAGERRRDPDLLVMVGAASVVIAAFLAFSVWTLVAAGYWVVALLLVVHVALVFVGARD